MSTQLDKYPKLQLPKARLQLLRNNDDILVFDRIRRKKVLLEPEEWVRQHLVHYLIEHLNYPSGLIQLEVPVDVNHLKQRADVVAYDYDANPFLLVECKSFSVNLDQDCLGQLLRYNAKIKAPYILLTNGMEHHCFHYNVNEEALIPMEAFPEFVKKE